MLPIDDGNDLPVPGPADPGPDPAARAESGGAPVAARAEDLGIILSLDDLLPDANGEVVIVGPDGAPPLSIVTDQRICESGMTDHHVTADGLDVGGFAYCAFEGGTRLYYSPDLDLRIAQPES